MSEKIDDFKKGIVFGGDFNLFFEAKLEAQGGNPILKKKSWAKLIQIKEKFDLYDIWRIRNPSIINGTLLGVFKEEMVIFPYLIIYENLEKNPDVLAAFLTNDSPIMFSLFSRSEGTRVKGLWKHNNSLYEKVQTLIAWKNYLHTYKSYLP